MDKVIKTLFGEDILTSVQVETPRRWLYKPLCGVLFVSAYYSYQIRPRKHSAPVLWQR